MEDMQAKWHLQSLFEGLARRAPSPSVGPNSPFALTLAVLRSDHLKTLLRKRVSTAMGVDDVDQGLIRSSFEGASTAH
eukprot:5176141-Amphidinium_carterae.1